MIQWPIGTAVTGHDELFVITTNVNGEHKLDQIHSDAHNGTSTDKLIYPPMKLLNYWKTELV